MKKPVHICPGGWAGGPALCGALPGGRPWPLLKKFVSEGFSAASRQWTTDEKQERLPTDSLGRTKKRQPLCETCLVVADQLLELGLLKMNRSKVYWRLGTGLGGRVDLWPVVRDENVYSSIVVAHPSPRTIFMVPRGHAIPHLSQLTTNLPAAAELGREPDLQTVVPTETGFDLVAEYVHSIIR